MKFAFYVLSRVLTSFPQTVSTSGFDQVAGYTRSVIIKNIPETIIADHLLNVQFILN